MSFRTVREAQQALWPTVRESLDRHRELRDRVKADRNATTAAQARARKPWSRVCSEETVWAAAKADRLATDLQVELVKAARAWYACGPDASDEELDAADGALSRAVGAYLTDLSTIDDTESLPDEVLSATVSPSNTN